MRRFLILVLVFLSATFIAVPATANTCTAKRLKVKQVCGVVVDGSGVPVQGAALKLVSDDKAQGLTTEVVTQSDGHFSLTDAPTGDFYLAISAPQHNGGRWPLRITGRMKAGRCDKPLKVHLAGTKGWGCGDWVDQK
jgi:hypothetical protein